MALVYLALGSNLGDRAGNLRAAINGLPPQVRVMKVSRIYETEPWGVTDQPRFLNQVIAAETELAPEELLGYVKDLENRIGRTPGVRYGPRVIDIDILSYDDAQMDLPGLQIPHPRLVERAFVLVPLADLAPGWRHPTSGMTAADLLASLDSSGVQPWSQQVLPWGTRTFLMGILNITPDSFSGDGLMTTPQVVEQALAQARAFTAVGVDILDIGGESTRPGAQPVSADEEMDRVIPVISALKAAGLPAILSIDTYKARVAEVALQAGAHWINDVWALRADPDLAGVAARSGAPLILMHNRSKPAHAELQDRLGGRYIGMQYNDLLSDVRAELMESAAVARLAGVPLENIILDPGIGFGKTVEQNLELINRLDEIRSLGYPVLLGPSRKSFIGYTLDLPPDQRVEGTAAAVVVGIVRGADIVRVHDVEPIARVVRMTDAIVRPRPHPAG